MFLGDAGSRIIKGVLKIVVPDTSSYFVKRRPKML